MPSRETWPRPSTNNPPGDGGRLTAHAPHERFFSCALLCGGPAFFVGMDCRGRAVRRPSDLTYRRDPCMTRRFLSLLLALCLCLAMPLMANGEEAALTVTDMMGREITLEGPAQRVVRHRRGLVKSSMPLGRRICWWAAVPIATIRKRCWRYPWWTPARRPDLEQNSGPGAGRADYGRHGPDHRAGGSPRKRGREGHCVQCPGHRRHL